MNLTLSGHDDRYAVEQLLLSLFPEDTEVTAQSALKREGGEIIVTSTVQENGYARWYRVGGNAGKSMTVRVPEDAGFWVYDTDGQVTASSVLWGDTRAELPQDGFVVFAGDPGARFHLSFQ